MCRTFILPTCLALTAVLAGCSSNDTGIGPDAGASDAPPTQDASDLTTTAARAICGALFRCCTSDLEEYFAPYRDNELLASFKDRLPPAATLDETSCRAVVKDMLDVVSLGDWARAVSAGSVELDREAFDGCIADLDTAACGAPARRALWDSTCLGYAAPAGGTEQRKFIRRTHGVGAECTPIRDGFGGVFYGTCDPTATFCCYADSTDSGCQFPSRSDGTKRPGTCAPVAALGQTCSNALPLTLCATGNECSDDTSTCIGPSTATLSIGDTCIDASYHVLGECQASWCDLFGSQRCEAQRADGASCDSGEQCTSGRCEQTCRPNDVCTSSPGSTGGTPDAGVPPASTGDGETCATAPTLASQSTTSPVAGFTSRVTASFGSVDNYNPLDTSGKAPGCSIVYDARGKEVAYSVYLAPGDRLRARATLTDGKQPALYLLSTCPGASWPDFDGSGRCGSNEYNVGLCGITGCDPATLDIQYPTSLGGQATTGATFWLVVDQVGGDNSAGFVLDWRVGT